MSYSLKKEAQELIFDENVPVAMRSYDVQEDIVRYAFEKFPQNIDEAAIEAKVKLLNLFYSTGIQATVQMSEHIAELAKSVNLDEKMKNGDLSVVKQIATLELSTTTRVNYSFATKYCANHYPDKYPIYDSLVAELLCGLFAHNLIPPYRYVPRKSNEKNCFTKTDFAAQLRDYNFFKNVYDAFMQQFDLNEFTYREVDLYLWNAAKYEEEFLVEKLSHYGEPSCK